MPQLNYGSEKLRDIIYRNENSVLKRYLKEPFNIDGWRFDVADVMARNEILDVYHEVWQEIYQEVKKTKPDAVVLAEEWADAWEMFDTKQWDSTMNYFQAARPLREFAGTGDLFMDRQADLAKIHYPRDASHLGHRILQFLTKIPSQVQYQMLNLIDSHDIIRLYHMPNITTQAFQGASVILFGLPGATSIWYGDEQLLAGHGHSTEGTRYPMNWDVPLTPEQSQNFQLYQRLCPLKTSREALQTGGFKIISMTGDLFAFARFTKEEFFLFMWSQSDEVEQLEVSLADFGMSEIIQEVLFGDVTVNQEGGQLKVTLVAKGFGLVGH